MRILVSNENPERYISTGDARRWVKYHGYKWTGKHGKSPIKKDPNWRPPSTIPVLHADIVQGYYVGNYDYPEMTLIPIVAGNKFPVNVGKHQYTTMEYVGLGAGY